MCSSPVLSTEYVAVILTVPCGFAETPLTQQVLADPPYDVFRYLVEHLQIPGNAEVRHARRAEVQEIGVIEFGSGREGDDDQDVVLPQVARHRDGGGLGYRG